jgi:glycosyltransferase involved in cell wall biosynthesis
MKPLVSVIMAAHNEEQYIADSIQSVLKQTYSNWELLIIDNASTDNTSKIIHSFNDSRMVILYEEKPGVSRARNHGLRKMKGEYFCFLDADDQLTPNSIEIRINKFAKNENLAFVDGIIQVYNEDFSQKIRTFKPAFTGNPHQELVKLNHKCFYGPSWLIKRKKGVMYEFNPALTHCEDLLFYIRYSMMGIYSYVEDNILIARKHKKSAMTNLNGLGNGYMQLLKILSSSDYEFPVWKKLAFDLKRRKIMLLSYTHEGNFLSGCKYFVFGN